MRRRILSGTVFVLVLALAPHAYAADWPYAGPMPDQPVRLPPTSFASVNAGTKSYRPVDPMPWGDVNARVAPPPKPSPTTTTPNEPHH